MKSIFIPKKIQVTSNPQLNTSSGQIAFVIIEDEHGDYPALEYFNSWKYPESEVFKFDNLPLSGYHIYPDSNLDNEENLTVADPRNFEFQISYQNLMHIVMNSNIIDRKISDECVFAWDYDINQLILLPVNSENYQEAAEYTKQKFSEVK